MSWEKPQGEDGPQDVVPSQRVQPRSLESMRQAGLPVIREGTGLPEPSRTSGGEPFLVGVFGDVRRSGRFALGSSTKAVMVFGDIVLDLREADLPAGASEIEVYSMFGDLKLIVPPDVEVDLQGFTVFGEHRNNRGQSPSTIRRRVTVRAYGMFGDVKVKTLAVGEIEPKWWRRKKKS